ncbi:MAG: hypothetical protein WC365_03740 [Candidatus Babeliales bacterium]|jgi:hypothetical protein
MEAKLDQQRKNINPEIWLQLKVLAVKEGTTVAKIIERALKSEFKRLEAQNEK